MLVGIDFIGTYQADPDCFREIVEVFTRNGHQCIIVTSGPANPMEMAPGRRAELLRHYVGEKIPIVFSGDSYKDEATRLAGYDVDVWIDDMPSGISRGGQFVI